MVTGASGYIGGRLVPRLLEAGHHVRCLVRNPEKLVGFPWHDLVEVVQGDVLTPTGLGASLEGCDAAFYLVHSMDGAALDFRDRDRAAAENFRNAAAAASLGRIVYLGGLGHEDDLSRHLASRQEVGRILADGPTPVTELRAAVIIGSGSVSFEMLRYLTEVLPAMVTPRWVRTLCQPIAVADVLDILTHAIQNTDGRDHVHEIGGPDRLTYEDMMRIYADVAGLARRWIIPVPVLSPKLSSHWVGLVTPLPTGVAKPLVESLRNEVIARDNTYAEQIASPLLSYREAVTEALARSANLQVTTRWSDATDRPAQAFPGDPVWSGGTTQRSIQIVETSASPAQLFRAFSRIGGDHGYYTMNWAWTLRGIVDALAGGVGLRRGRRHPEEIRAGEALDFWRVVHVEPGRRLKLYAQMKLPGEAWLAFEALAAGSGAQLRQTAIFIPRGLLGRLYWWVLMPFHIAIFGRMARKIALAAEAELPDLQSSLQS